MPWSSEVIGHAVILTSPLAVCYAARVLARIARRLEESTSGFKSPTRSLRSFCIAAEPLYKKQHEVFQYSNAAFCYQSSCECSGDAADGDEADLDFCIITPQQALGVLGDHAPHFTKIFLNGLTFIADGSEPGMVLSVDEYADLMHSVATRPRPTENSAFSTCLTPTAQYELEEEASACSDSSPASCRSVASTMTFLSGSERSTSHRSSLDMTPCSSLSRPRCDGPCHRCDEQAPKSYAEELPLRAASQVCNSILMCADPTPCERGAAWHGSHVALDTCRGGGKGCTLDSPFGTAAGQQLAIAASCCSTVSGRTPACKQTRRVSGATSITSCGGAARHQATPDSASPRASPRTPNVNRQHLVSAHSHAHHARHSPKLSPSEKAARRPWVPSGSRAAPPPLPASGPKSAASLLHHSTPTAYRCQAATSEPVPRGEQWSGPADSSPASSAWEDDLRQPSEPGASRPLQPALYPRPSLSSVSLSSSPPTGGLCRAPALPLPDGSAADSSVPPALRYYLAQARAAGVQHEAFVGVCSDGGAVSGSSSGLETSRRRQTAAGLEHSVGQPGFVRATVAQLNTQRLVTCHVTPFAAAKTSRKPRPLTKRGGPDE